MKYRRLGKSGVQVSVLSFGTWLTFGQQIDNSIAEKLMGTAYDTGVNFFDNAEIYSDGEAEVVMGKLLKKFNWDRTTYLVSSKVFWGGNLPNQIGLSRKHIREACDRTLKKLHLDYLDFYFCHRPDVNTPIEETVRIMTELIHQGKVLYWGTSEWSAAEIYEAYGVAREFNLIPPTMEQPQYNMFHREKIELEFLPLYKNMGLGTTIWSPLASGLLTGKYNKELPQDTRVHLKGMEHLKTKLMSEENKEKIKKVQKLEKISQEIGVSMAQMAIAWCACNTDVSTVVLGASKVQQLHHNLKAIELMEKMNSEVMEEIEQVLQNKPNKVVFT